MRVAIFIPCYNCEAQIGNLLRNLDTLLEKTAMIEQVLLVENNLNGNTLAAAKTAVAGLGLNKKIKFFQNEQNYGLGGSHKVGIQFALNNSFSHMVVFHGDNQADLQDLNSILAYSETHGGKTVLGSRFTDLTKLSGYSKIRTVGNILLNWLYSVFTFRKIEDLGSGLNVLNLENFKDENFLKFSDGFTFNMDLLLDLITYRKPFRFYPIRWSTTDQVSNARAVLVGAKALATLLKWRMGFENSDSGLVYETKIVK